MHALILAGGSGTRFWPLSRRRQPKHLLPLDGDRSLLQATVERLEPLIPPQRVWVATTAELLAPVRDQLPDVPAAQFLVEPVGRNTAPAIGYALHCMPAAVRSEVVAVLPADHRIADPASFRRTLGLAAEVAARDDRILTLGVKPHRPEPGFGHLELGEPLPRAEGLRRVRRFTEKPDPETAARWTAAGTHLWNAGMFVFRGTTLLAALARHAPQIARGLEAIADRPDRLQELYPQLDATSIDYGVMEHLDALATLPLDCGWSDLGSWQALAEVAAAGSDGNAVRGDATVIDARDNLVAAEEGHVAVLGVSGLVVVRTADAVLVMPKKRAQEVRKIVDSLRRRGREELL
ncbi:MAG: mannose-1-phosphate guanylyltransferase [Acidobacteria bacterium]|nr:MAG: mannose-1-phosphate guanylyltransferase [Acidobacteriota bacterium]